MRLRRRLALAFFLISVLQQALVEASAAGIDEVLVSVEQAIRDFRGNAEPADDATMMALRLGKPVGSDSTLTPTPGPVWGVRLDSDPTCPS